jgi:site-specific recombinase XerD
MKSNDIFLTLVEGFFINWLTGMNVSAKTISSYRDAFILFFRWMNEIYGSKPDTITMKDFTMKNIELFLTWLADIRGNGAKTINCRLAAMRSFCRYASFRDPTHIDEYRKISAIPQRVEHKPELSYLTAKEIGWLIDTCDNSKKLGRETRLLIQLLYNSGGRISEVIAIKFDDIIIDNTGKFRVRILGKGRKERTLPLWKQTGDAIKVHICDNGLHEKDYLFGGRGVEHLTRSGARSRLDSAMRAATEKHPELSGKSANPHIFRHSTAMAMLCAGIDISTIAIWLGHENIQTTHKYMVSDISIKEDAIERIRGEWQAKNPGRYKPSKGIIAFLESL